MEVVGVAGAGKTSLARLLCGGEGWRAAGFIHARSPVHLFRLARALPRLWPLLRRGPDGRRFTWADLKLLAYVSQWRRVLARGRGSHRGVSVLDQGPVYALVRLKAEGRGDTAGPGFERWWTGMMDAWAQILDVVVWLDAPDEVLWRRIKKRAQGHPRKGASAEAGLAFIGGYRRLFEEVLDRVERRGGPRILRFDTEAIPSDRLAEEVRAVLEAPASVHAA